MLSPAHVALARHSSWRGGDRGGAYFAFSPAGIVYSGRLRLLRPALPPLPATPSFALFARLIGRPGIYASLSIMFAPRPLHFRFRPSLCTPIYMTPSPPPPSPPALHISSNLHPAFTPPALRFARRLLFRPSTFKKKFWVGSGLHTTGGVPLRPLHHLCYLTKHIPWQYIGLSVNAMARTDRHGTRGLGGNAPPQLRTYPSSPLVCRVCRSGTVSRKS